MPKSEKRNCQVVVIRDAWGVSYELGLLVSNYIESFSPEYWAFTNPGTFTVCFDDEHDGSGRAARLVAGFPDLLGRIEEAKELGIGRACGQLLVSFGDEKRWDMIAGTALSEATRAASVRS